MDETTTKRRQDSVAHYLRFASGPWQCRFGMNVQAALGRIDGNKKPLTEATVNGRRNKHCNSYFSSSLAENGGTNNAN